MARVEFKLPDVGEGMHEGEIAKWLVKVGDKVKSDQPLVEVQTDKALVELPSPVAGTIVELNGAEGELVPVGTVIVVIETEDGVAAVHTARDVPAAPAPAAPATPAAPAAGAAAAVARAPGQRALAAPATRRLARELGVDINAVPGTGPGGRVTPEDVRAFAAGGAAAVPAGAEPAAAPVAPATPVAPAAQLRPVPVPWSEERVPLRGLRRKIAEKMVQSKFTAPHVTCVEEVDMTELVAMRASANKLLAERGLKLTYMPFIIKAVVGALKEFPQLNSSLDDEKQELVIKHYYNIGVATATEDGLMVPVVHNADQLSLIQLGQEIALLAEQARSRKIDLNRLQGSTFTISNIGNIGGLFATPVINYPEVAILGVNRMQQRPVVRDGEIVIRDMMYVNLSFDHRVIDGDTAVMFLNRIVRYLENPNLMFMELV